MIFYGDGVVWDAALSKELMAFAKRTDKDGKRLPGIFETNDAVVIMKLEAAGYKGEGERPKMPEAKEEPAKIPEVKEEKKPEVKVEDVKVDKRSEKDRQKDFFNAKDKDKKDERTETD
jgi:hypothetical protein